MPGEIASHLDKRNVYLQNVEFSRIYTVDPTICSSVNSLTDLQNPTSSRVLPKENARKWHLPNASESRRCGDSLRGSNLEVQCSHKFR